MTQYKKKSPNFHRGFFNFLILGVSTPKYD